MYQGAWGCDQGTKDLVTDHVWKEQSASRWGYCTEIRSEEVYRRKGNARRTVITQAWRDLIVQGVGLSAQKTINLSLGRK
jgi:hypothetical protein